MFLIPLFPSLIYASLTKHEHPKWSTMRNSKCNKRNVFSPLVNWQWATKLLPGGVKRGLKATRAAIRGGATLFSRFNCLDLFGVWRFGFSPPSPTFLFWKKEYNRVSTKQKQREQKRRRRLPRWGVQNRRCWRNNAARRKPACLQFRLLGCLDKNYSFYRFYFP